MTPLIDPQHGDFEDDASSTKQRSLFAIAGSLLAEISLPKLLAAWLLLIVLPGILLGLTPLIASAWLAKFSRTFTDSLGGIWPMILLALVAALGWFGGRPLFRAAEQGFWSLNSLAVQPCYALCREGLRHLLEHLMPRTGAESRVRLRAASAAGAGIFLCAIALSIVVVSWPASRWMGEFSYLKSPQHLIIPTLANAAVILGTYFALAALTWGIADASMPQPRDLARFDDRPRDGRTWRVAHLSDLHIVGERYGFRIESGRSGPRGNERIGRILAQIDKIHAKQPLDLILITGDITDAGRSAEWAEFLAALAGYPNLAKRMIVLPGNHDINVADRANPARLELPTSPGRRMRELRALSSIAAIQGDKVYVIDPSTRRLGTSLNQSLSSRMSDIVAFANSGTLWLSVRLSQVWAESFPMVLPPDADDGLGVIALNSTTQTHFSFTNALGLISAEQERAMHAIAGQFPRAHWIVALHHHLVEYPKLATSFSERIGTALINGTWFVRQLQQLSDKIIVMHGHRHIDWIGRCGDLRIVSAPSPVMEVTDEKSTCFYVHSLAADRTGRLRLLTPECIEIAGTKAHA
jgi:predicted MPP superfamily phosphohydrolase